MQALYKNKQKWFWRQCRRTSQWEPRRDLTDNHSELQCVCFEGYWLYKLGTVWNYCPSSSYHSHQIWLTKKSGWTNVRFLSWEHGQRYKREASNLTTACSPGLHGSMPTCHNHLINCIHFRRTPFKHTKPTHPPRTCSFFLFRNLPMFQCFYMKWTITCFRLAWI